MNYPSERFVDFFTSPFVYFVLVASLVSSCAVLITRPMGKFEQYAIELEIRNATDPVPHKIKGETFEFTFCCFGGCGPDMLDFAEGVGDILMTMLFLLPALAVLILISLVTALLPGMDPAQYQAAASVAFVYYTSYYWLSMAYLIYNPPGDWGSWRDELKIISIFDGKS